MVTGRDLRAGHTKSCGCLKAEGNYKHFPSPKVQRQRYADKKEIVDGDKTWTALGGAAEFLGVSPQTILRWAIKCGWLDGMGIEQHPFKDGLNREVPYYLKADRDKERRNKAASLEMIKRAQARKMVPDVPGHKYFNDAAADLGISPRHLRKRLKKKCPNAKIKKVEGRSKDGYARLRSFIPNWAFVRLGGKLSSDSSLDSALEKIIAAIEKNGTKATCEIKNEIAAAIKSMSPTILLDSDTAQKIFADKIIAAINKNGRTTASEIKNEIAALIKKQADATTTKDGPVSAGVFSFGGTPYPVAPARWRLIKALWGKGAVTVSTIADAVYSDDNACEGKLKNLVFITNESVFLGNKLPFAITSPMAGHYSLELLTTSK